MKPVTQASKWTAAACALAVLVGLTGCHSGVLRLPRAEKVFPDPLVVAELADQQRPTEVQLVEQMAQHRRSYEEYLERLEQFYDLQGNQLKATWAISEQKKLKRGPRREYLVMAEVAGPDLRATESIPEAQQLYSDAIKELMAARSKFGKMFIDKEKLYGARDKFIELITEYPQSDKIDDAAFQIGEIYRHYLKDYPTALLYYQRVRQWDPRTPLPVSDAMARIYDHHVHDRIKALNYYRQAIELESAFPANMVYAENRILKITEEMTE